MKNEGSIIEEFFYVCMRLESLLFLCDFKNILGEKNFQIT